MDDLHPFYMEDYLESNRFHARYNLGESGNTALTVQEILTGSLLSPEEISQGFTRLLLRDSPNWGRDDLRDLIAHFHPGAHRENVLLTTGTSEALFLLFRYLKPKKIALPLPGFQLLYEIPQSLGAQIIPLPVLWNEKHEPYILEQEWLDILHNEKPDCVLINNP
ncbi:MAG: hypothetical protein K2X39_08930, partial [Silvanigrellaceae bacterium]|nr:hypothetical protein [Silvanigrellaceae bacterium]